MVAAISSKLLPDSCRVDQNDSLLLAGLKVSDLAAEFGTPLFIYDVKHIRQRCAEFLRVFGQGTVAYANKAFTCQALVELIESEGLRFDVSSSGELATVLAAGVSGEKCIVHGSNKSKTELLKALEVKATIVIDSLDEMKRLKELLRRRDFKAQFLLRIAPAIDSQTHVYLDTGTVDSKFGLSIADGSFKAALQEISSWSTAQVLGLHAHIGSQIVDLQTHQQALVKLMQITKQYGLPLLSIGGGLGVAYTAEMVAPTIDQFGQAVAAARKSSRFDGDIWVEPGRSIVAQAALMVYEIGTIKSVAGLRCYVSVDGGMNDNPRPALYRSRYEAFLPNQMAAQRDLKVRIVGKCCESGDVLVFDGHLPSSLKVGELLAIPMSGAYHYSMSSNYHRLPRPAVVFVENGRARVVIRRQTEADLLALDN